jgi:hypothetical protein
MGIAKKRYLWMGINDIALHQDVSRPGGINCRNRLMYFPEIKINA